MSVEDCPDCRKLQSECEALERELATARAERDELRFRLSKVQERLREPDPRAPVPTYIPAAVPEERPPALDVDCPICFRPHP